MNQNQKDLINKMGNEIGNGESSSLEGWNLLHGMDLSAYDAMNVCGYFRSMGEIPSLMPDYDSIQRLHTSKTISKHHIYEGFVCKGCGSKRLTDGSQCDGCMAKLYFPYWSPDYDSIEPISWHETHIDGGWLYINVPVLSSTTQS